MSDKQARAVEIAVAYYRAWTTNDMDEAPKLLARDVVCHAPSGAIKGIDAVRSFMEPYAASLTGTALLAAHGTGNEALLMYETANRAVQHAPAAELYRIEDNHINEIRIIFDRLPFALARGQVVAA